MGVLPQGEREDPAEGPAGEGEAPPQETGKAPAALRTS